MAIEKKTFGALPNGTAVDLFTLRNEQGAVASITNYGGIIVSLCVPDRDGKIDDIVLGFETLASFLKKSPYFGALIGRYGNRIAEGKFTLHDVEYTLARNDGSNHLHGGMKGFDKVVWTARETRSDDGDSLELSYVSPDGEEGYPGTLRVTVTYTLTAGNALKIEYSATTDKDTIVNLTNHSYFNLLGAASGQDILGHELQLHAKHFTVGGSGLIPTGEVRDVTGTPFDFTTATAIGARIQDKYEQLQLAGGYDHNFTLDHAEAKLVSAANVYEPVTGRVMEVLTTEPGIQFYSGNFLDGSITGKGKIVYQKHAGFCLETQHYPNSPNIPEFPSTVLRPGEEYTQTTVYTFSTR